MYARLACIEMCTEGDQQRLAALHGAPKEQPRHVLSTACPHPLPPRILALQGEGWGRQDCEPRPDPLDPSRPCASLDSPATHMLITQASGSSWDIGRARVPLATLQPSSLLSLSPTSSEKIYGKIKGPFFQYLLIFMAVFTAICF